MPPYAPEGTAPAGTAADAQPAAARAATWPGDEYSNRFVGSVPVHFTENGGTYAGPSLQYSGRAKSLLIGIEVPFAYSDDEELGGSPAFLLANPTATLRLDLLDRSTLRLDAGFGVALPLAAIDRSSSFTWRQGAAALGGVADMQGLWDVWRYRPGSLGLYGVFGVHYLADAFEMRLDTGAGFVLANDQSDSVTNFVIQQRAALGYRTPRLGVGAALIFAQMAEMATPDARTQQFVVTRPLKSSERDPGMLSAEPYIEFTPGRGIVRLAFSVAVVDNVENATGEAYDEAVGDPIETPWSATLAVGSRF